MKLKGNRPKFDTPEQLQAAFNGYFDITPVNSYSLTGLALAVGTSRKTLENYSKNPDFKPVVDEARLIVEYSYEMRLTGKAYKGAMFALKNLGWDDTNRLEVTPGKDANGNDNEWKITFVTAAAPEPAKLIGKTDTD